MNAVERQNRIFILVCNEGILTCSYVADFLEVCERTIRRDALELSRKYPVEVIRGRYGGVKRADWFEPTAVFLSTEQMQWLGKIAEKAPPKDRIMANSILVQFRPR